MKCVLFHDNHDREKAMAGLVLEGGTFRPIFSAGVMDALLDYNMHFDYVIGVSAGITNGISYTSGQRGRNWDILKQYRNDPRYISLGNMVRTHSPFGLDFLFDELPNGLAPFDWQAMQDFDGRIRVGVTDALTGKVRYLDAKQMDKKCTMLRATCAIPLYFPPVILDNRQYFDGGIADSIPIRQSLQDGNRKNLIILTQPAGFRKGQSKTALAAARIYRNRFSGLCEALEHRPQMYNNTLCFCEKLEQYRPKDTVILRPAHKLHSFEGDIGVLEQSYQHGYDMAVENMERIAALVEA